MPRELMEAPAPAMVATAPVGAVPSSSRSSLLHMVVRPNLETKVIVLWVAWIILRQLQSILGPKRRRSRHLLVQYGAWAAYYLPTLIALYTANAAYSSSSKNKLVLLLGSCVLLFLCARGAVTMTAFTLADGSPSRLQSWRLLLWLLYFAWLLWGSLMGGHKLRVSYLYAFIFICILPISYVLVVKPRAALLDYETKEFADYMVRQSRSSSPFFFPGNPNAGLHDGCKYPLMLIRNDQWIDFSDVLQEDVAVDPDTCLSYSFCRLLARRYFGFPCAEDGNAQVRDFVLKELLADCNRGFTIVEVQLALLHDYFFTNYHTVVASGFVSRKKGIVYWLREFLMHIGYTTFGFLITHGYKRGRSAHIGYTTFVSWAVPMIIILIVIQQPEFPFLPRHWHPIHNLFLFYNEDATSSPAPLSRRSSRSRVSYWRNKMGQYSVLEDYDRRSPMKPIIIAWCKVHLLSQPSYSFIKHHPSEEKDVSVPDSLRRLVARTIRDINGPPTIGVRSLAQLDDLTWTCRQDTLTHTILIWHIATCYCDMSGPLEDETTESLEEDPSATGDYRNVATTLSRYCAYLVAFLPELVPEHNLTAKAILQQVLEETTDLLGRTRMSMDDKRARIEQILPPEDESSLTTFHKGVRLGQHLRRLGVSLRWKTIADLWAEMILYVASSSGNATTHIEQLAQGGEFVTHLWALLCNAGISRSEAGNGGTDPTEP